MFFGTKTSLQAKFSHYLSPRVEREDFLSVRNLTSIDHMGKSWTKHSKYDRKWEHLNLFEYRCFIHCNIPIYQNKKTKKTQAIEVPFARYKRRFTHKYEKRVLELLAIHYNFTEVAR